MTIGPPQAMDIWFMCEFLGIRAQKKTDISACMLQLRCHHTLISG